MAEYDLTSLDYNDKNTLKRIETLFPILGGMSEIYLNDIKLVETNRRVHIFAEKKKVPRKYTYVVYKRIYTYLLSNPSATKEEVVRYLIGTPNIYKDSRELNTERVDLFFIYQDIFPYRTLHLQRGLSDLMHEPLPSDLYQARDPFHYLDTTVRKSVEVMLQEKGINNCTQMEELIYSFLDSVYRNILTNKEISDAQKENALFPIVKFLDNFIVKEAKYLQCSLLPEQKGGKRKVSQKKYIMFQGKRYCVRKEERKQYIQSKNVKILLKDIRGQYKKCN